MLRNLLLRNERGYEGKFLSWFAKKFEGASLSLEIASGKSEVMNLRSFMVKPPFGPKFLSSKIRNFKGLPGKWEFLNIGLDCNRIDIPESY